MPSIGHLDSPHRLVGACRRLVKARARHDGRELEEPWLVEWRRGGALVGRAVVSNSAATAELAASLDGVLRTLDGVAVVLVDHPAVAAYLRAGGANIEESAPTARGPLDAFEATLDVHRAPEAWSHYHLGVSEELLASLYTVLLMYDSLGAWPAAKASGSSPPGGSPLAIRREADGTRVVSSWWKGADESDAGVEVRAELMQPSDVPSGLLREVAGARWDRARDGRVPIARTFGRAIGVRALLRVELLRLSSDLAREAVARASRG